jgi:hypothetical protein
LIAEVAQMVGICKNTSAVYLNFWIFTVFVKFHC